MLNNHVAVVLDLVLFVVVVVALLNYYVRFAFFWIWFSMLYWTLLVHRLLLSVRSTHKTSLSDGILAAYQSPGHAQSLQPAITCVSVNQNGFHRNCISFIRRSRIHRIAGLNLWSCLRCRLQSASCQSGSANKVHVLLYFYIQGVTSPLTWSDQPAADWWHRASRAPPCRRVSAADNRDVWSPHYRREDQQI